MSQIRASLDARVDPGELIGEKHSLLLLDPRIMARIDQEE